MAQPRRNCPRHLVIEAREPQLRGDDKESKQQENGRQVDGGAGIVRGQAAKNHHGNGPQQYDANAIQLQARYAAQCDAGISDHKNRQNERLSTQAGGKEGGRGAHRQVIPECRGEATA